MRLAVLTFLAGLLIAPRPARTQHAPPEKGVVPWFPLLIRAVRIGDPADTLRETARGGTRGGYPSTVHLPTPGRWLVVATSGADWGCFVLTVADPKILADDSR